MKTEFCLVEESGHILTVRINDLWGAIITAQKRAPSWKGR